MTDEYWHSRPDTSVGFAFMDEVGFPFADTVATTERAAMVNALVTLFGVMPMANWTDGKIKAEFERVAKRGTIGPVGIERLDVVPDARSRPRQPHRSKT